MNEKQAVWIEVVLALIPHHSVELCAQVADKVVEHHEARFGHAARMARHQETIQEAVGEGAFTKPVKVRRGE